MANRRRVFRVAERVRNIVAMELIQAGDPRFHLVTVTSCMVTPDLRLAKIYWTVNAASEERERRKSEALEAFESATGVFKRLIGDELQIKFVPQLRFYYDDTLDEQERVNALFERIKAPSE